MGTPQMMEIDTEPLMKFFQLHIELCKLQKRGKKIREPFNAMMKWKLKRYSLLLGLENNSPDHGVDPEQVKKEIKELETFLDFNTESLSSWDSSMVKRDEFYLKHDLPTVLVLDSLEKCQDYLSKIPNARKIFQGYYQGQEHLIDMQQKIIIRLEESVESYKSYSIFNWAYLQLKRL